MLISVIICTFNRSESLLNTLQSFIIQDIDDAINYELVIVDNNSKDNTADTINSYIKKNHRIRYVHESRQGLSNARNTGIKEAKGDVLCFTDDDVIIDKKWLSNIFAFIKQENFDAIGGKILPQYPPDAPSWVKECADILNGPIVYHNLGDLIKEYSGSMIPFVGANMIFKRQCLLDIGGFDSNLGLGKGTMGEDNEIFHRLRKNNKKIIYHPDIIIFHPVEKERMTLRYVAKWCLKSGKYTAACDMNQHKTIVSIMGIPRYLLREVAESFLLTILSIFDKRRFIHYWQKFFHRLGMVIKYRETICQK